MFIEQLKLHSSAGIIESRLSLTIPDNINNNSFKVNIRPGPVSALCYFPNNISSILEFLENALKKPAGVCKS